LKFKAEVTLLIVAIVLFALSMFCYSYYYPNTSTADLKTLNLSSDYPYRSLAVVFVGIASLSLLTASISFSKKTKPASSLNQSSR